MNEADSEKIAGWYEARGWKKAESMPDADEVVVNTCSVRESAEHRVMGLINNLIKKKTKKQKIIVTGCMLRYPLRVLKEKMPKVDEFKKLKDIIHNSQIAARNSKNTAYIPIMEGCDNFCTYCVVPYARGKEASRPFGEVICEVEELVKRGHKEIMLLGQNVNSYGKDFSKEEKQHFLDMYNILTYSQKSFAYYTPFAILLYKLNQITELKKISFMTSNPWDLSDDIIEVMKLPKIDRYLHLPVQSGDDEIIKRMNRHYSTDDYIKLVAKIRRAIPEIKIGTDIIVGFPGETDSQFQNTVKLCRRVGFVKAYVARYSPRPGTAAYKLKDDVSAKEKKLRWQILDNLINKPLNKILVLCGPTATGKTDLGIELAKELDGEIVSADSRQVYKGMDVGTGKDLPKNSKFKIQNSKLQFKSQKYDVGYYLFNDVPVWLLDIVKPGYQFTVADYIECANLVINNIWKRGKLPILVGGTGFYIKGVVDGIETLGVEPDWELREKLKNEKTEKLKDILGELDPQKLAGMNESDINNPRRLIRAIEIEKSSNNQIPAVNPRLNLDNILMIGLAAPYEIIYERINKRVKKRIREGLIEETKRLINNGYSWDNSVLGTTIGYREWKPYFENKETKEDAMKCWEYDEHSYARRQMTWFKRDNRINWIDITQNNRKDNLENIVKKWYHHK